MPAVCGQGVRSRSDEKGQGRHAVADICGQLHNLAHSVFAALARRKGDVWYLAAIAGAGGRDAAFDTSFLGAGRWDADIFADGPNSDRDATDYVHQRRTVAAGEKLAVKIPSDGGYIVRFTQAK